ncbi:MAG: nucleotidyltransferase family protein [Endomicrobiia bacterium]|nr:nucleotidyltransferase family protein [Endomicrobiia bacterium]
MKTLEEIKNTINANRRKLESEYKVKTLGIFGSYIRAKQDSKSDLDLLVEFEVESIGGFRYIQLEDYLSEILDVKVDLVMKSALRPAIGKHILREVAYL